MLFYIFSLTGGGADKLNTGVGEDDTLNDDHGRYEAIGQPATGIRNETKASRIATRVAEDEDTDGHQHEDDQCNNLNQREPILQLAEDLHREHIEYQDAADNYEGKCPLRNGIEPRRVLAKPFDVDSYGCAIRHQGHGPISPVQPAGNKGGLLAVKLAGIGNEGTGAGAVDDELAKRTQDDIAEEATNKIEHREKRSGVLQTTSGAQKKTGTDGRTDGDHLQLAIAHSLLQTVVF